MSKIRKSFLRSSAMLLAVMVLSSGVAEAQRCEARAATGANAVSTVRAEGETEQIGGIELRCVPATGTSLFDIADFTLSITLNTPVTNFASLTYTANLLDTNGALGGTIAADNFDGTAANNDGPMVDADEDPNTITWEDLDGATLGLGTGGFGFNVVIGGIRANANMVGDGGDITATLTANTAPVSPGTIDVSAVKTGLEIKVDDANVLQCETMETGMATITITEGFATAIQNQDASDGGDANYGVVRVNFTGIPKGVSVMITNIANNDVSATDTADDPMKFTLTTTSTATVADGMIPVTLDDDGEGSVTYNVSDAPTDTSPVVQSNVLMVSFSWDEDTTIADGMVNVGFVSGASNDVPQFADAMDMRVIGFDPCETSMRFPFVTNMYGYETGIAFTNASDYAGACMISFFGSADNPDPMTTMEVPSWGSMTYALSMIAPGFQGFLDVTCDFENGHGFAFIANGFGSMGGPTAAQGYLAQEPEELQ